MVKPWIKKGEERVLAERYGKALVVQDYLNHKGETVEWSYFCGKCLGCSIFMPITVDNEVVAVEQFRGGSGRIMLELPGGVFDEGEDTYSAAERELEEETGYCAEQIIMLKHDPIVIDPAAYFNGGYFALLMLNCKKVSDRKHYSDPNENIELKLIPLKEWVQKTFTGLIDDAKSIVLTHLALPYLIKEKLITPEF